MLRRPNEGASHQHDRLKHHGHHWIEEGTYEDFKKCVLTSDLPVVTFAFASTYGAPMWRALQGAADRAPEIHSADYIVLAGQTEYFEAKVEQ